jgi:hypothetical protein
MPLGAQLLIRVLPKRWKIDRLGGGGGGVFEHKDEKSRKKQTMGKKT